MDCKVAYQVGKRPGRFTRLRTGTMCIDETGLRIDGPVPYRADFSEIQWLKASKEIGLFHIAVGSSPPVFIAPILSGLFGFIWVVRPSLSEEVYYELHRRVGEL